jgi:hypothetical protein
MAHLRSRSNPVCHRTHAAARLVCHRDQRREVDSGELGKWRGRDRRCGALEMKSAPAVEDWRAFIFIRRRGKPQRNPVSLNEVIVPWVGRTFKISVMVRACLNPSGSQRGRGHGGIATAAASPGWARPKVHELLARWAWGNYCYFIMEK